VATWNSDSRYDCIVVVADTCSDRTAAISRAHGAEVMEIDALNVGAARRFGFETTLHSAGPGPLPWLATTDADTEVPADWFIKLRRHRDRGADLVVGTVELSPDSRQPSLDAAWRRDYARKITTGGHCHVHGANLAMSAEAYLRLGGFTELPVGEDVDLVERANAARLRIAWALDMAVTTSRRLDGRAPGGFASYLKETLS
jgi:glycosyltransferase involved in cell wall biosynthesis